MDKDKRDSLVSAFSQFITKHFEGSVEGEAEVKDVLKSKDLELRKATFVVLSPEEEDLHGDIYSHAEVEKAADNWREFSGQANIEHLVQTEEARIVESYIAPIAMKMDNGIEIKKGAWLQTWQFPETETGDLLWNGVLDETFTGLSIGCSAKEIDLTKSAKRRLYDFNFNKEGAHVALVGKAANGYDVLITKSEVQVTLTMRKFLQTFFYLYYDDAALLAQLLGYESDVDEWTQEYIDEKVSEITLLKSLYETGEDSEISESDALSIVQLQKSFEANVRNAPLDFSGIEHKQILDDLILEQKQQITKAANEELISKLDENHELEEEEKLVLKSIQLNLEKKQKEGKLVSVEIQKALDAEKTRNEEMAKELEVLKAAAEKAKTAEVTEVVKSLGYVAEEDMESVVELFKSLESTDILMRLLEAAKSSADHDEMFVQKSLEGEAAEMDAYQKKVNKSLGINTGE